MRVQRLICDAPEEFNQSDYEKFFTEENYLYVPKGKGFNDIKFSARCLYGMLLLKLKYEGIVGISGQKFVHYPIDQIAMDMGYHKVHVNRLFRELERYNLVFRINHGNQAPVDIYINSPDKLVIPTKTPQGDRLD